jgi:hypothetical protein
MFALGAEIAQARRQRQHEIEQARKERQAALDQILMKHQAKMEQEELGARLEEDVARTKALYNEGRAQFYAGKSAEARQAGRHEKAAEFDKMANKYMDEAIKAAEKKSQAEAKGEAVGTQTGQVQAEEKVGPSYSQRTARMRAKTPLVRIQQGQGIDKAKLLRDQQNDLRDAYVHSMKMLNAGEDEEAIRQNLKTQVDALNEQNKAAGIDVRWKLIPPEEAKGIMGQIKNKIFGGQKLPTVVTEQEYNQLQQQGNQQNQRQASPGRKQPPPRMPRSKPGETWEKVR